MPEQLKPRKYRVVAVQTLDQANACIQLLKQTDPSATCTRAALISGVPYSGLPFRDDYGYPVDRAVFECNTRLTYHELVKLLYETAGNWIEIF